MTLGTLSGRRLPAGWILLCAYCNWVGWLLSALHALTFVGYAFAFLLGFVALAVYAKTSRKPLFAVPRLPKLRWRFRHLFPLGFALLAGLAFLGGALHGPSNYDAMSYRIPRVLHWLADGRWHWIHTDYNRTNVRACGIEWLSAPIIAFTRTDRFLFLINVASFLLLPGLIFSVLTQVGIRARVAWHWMWLLPTGYCYILQAGSVSNDMFSAVYSLAAIAFALQARKSGRFFDVAISVLSAALLTGAKTSNLPLLLPWAVAIVPILRLWLTRPLASACLIPLAIGASFLPTAILNYVHCGDWTGIKAEAEHAMLGNGPAWLYWLVNVIYLTISNVVPPLFPFASAWDRAVDAHLPATLARLMQHTYFFEPAVAHLQLPEMQIEEQAGLGFGLTLLLGLSVAAALLGRKRENVPCRRSALWLLCITPWISLACLMAKMNMFGEARYLASYYPLLIMGLLLSPAQACLVKRAWWRFSAAFACFLGALLLILSPHRPLWPVKAVFDLFGSRLQTSALGSRVMLTYRVKQERPQAFAPLVDKLPADATVVGLYAGEWPETSLWKPFGSRRILHCKLSDSPSELRARGLKYVLVTEEILGEPWLPWLGRMKGRDLVCMPLKLMGVLAPSTWHLVELEPEASIPKSASAPDSVD